MNKVIVLVLAFSVIYAVFSGNIVEVSNAAVNTAAEAIELTIFLSGGLMFWSGVMNLMKKGGITKIISKLLSPLLKIVFKGLDSSSNAMKAICMNISANFLGLGNAATPFGIEAMSELKKLNNKKDAEDYMVYFIVLNSASIQIIPTTLILLRSRYNSANPIEILPPSVLTSLISLFVGLFFAVLISKLRRKK